MKKGEWKLMTMKGWITSAAAGMVLLCASACQDSVNTVENAEKSMAPTSIADKRYITDGFLKDRLLLKGVNVSETAGGLLQVQVTAINARTGFFSELWSGMTGDTPYRVDYKFTWLDANGMAVESALSIWETVTITPGETVYFRSVAPNKSCRDFVLNLRESK